jgi:hypothetical protein
MRKSMSMLVSVSVSMPVSRAMRLDAKVDAGGGRRAQWCVGINLDVARRGGGGEGRLRTTKCVGQRTNLTDSEGGKRDNK